MNNKQIKQLETELWGAADGLRANSKLNAGEYKDPVLGLILWMDRKINPSFESTVILAGYSG